jgi:hypothetical protein
MGTRRTEITIETHQVWVARMSPATTREWCFHCCQPAGFVTLPHAARLAGVSPQELRAQSAEGPLHATQDHNGVLYICLISLLKAGLV